MRARGGDPQGAADLAVALPFAAAALFTPPLLHLFAKPVSLGGVPLIVLYVFGAWAGLIAVAVLLARRLDAGSEPVEERAPESEPGDADARG